MTDPRLDAHYVPHLGEGRPDTTVEIVEVWRHERPEFVSFATHGLAELPITTVYPQELVCSVQHGQDGAALSIVRQTLQLVLDARRGLVNDQIIAADQPLLASTDITGVLAGSHPYLDGKFDVLFGSEQAVAVEIMTLIPLTSSETRLGTDHGTGALISYLEEHDPPLLDITRT